jgi:hypothetical protein
MADLFGRKGRRKPARNGVFGEAPAGQPRKRRRAIGVMPLEPRIMYDAAAATTAANTTSAGVPVGGAADVLAAEVTPCVLPGLGDPAKEAAPPPPAAQPGAGSSAGGASSDPTTSRDASATELGSVGSSARDIVVIDGGVADLETLIAGIGSNHQVLVLDPALDGVQQIADFIAANDLHDLNSIQILSHGTPGTVTLGATTLTDANLVNYATTLGAIGASLSADGDILL